MIVDLVLGIRESVLEEMMVELGFCIEEESYGILGISGGGEDMW